MTFVAYSSQLTSIPAQKVTVPGEMMGKEDQNLSFLLPQGIMA